MFDWNELMAKYPHMENLMKRCEYHYNNYFDTLRKLEETCPVEGYIWMHDPNDDILVLKKRIDYTSEEWLQQQREYEYSRYLMLKEKYENGEGNGK